MSNYASLQINPVDSADLSEIENNIETNLGLITDWVVPCLPDLVPNKKAVLIGAGPSLKANLKAGFIHKDMFPSDDYVVFTCKHALPLLMEYGFQDLRCLVLDPRTIHGISTHNVKRKDLYDSAKPENVTFYVASMTHPDVTQHLIDNGYTVVGWHAASKALEKFKERAKFNITGGTNSILRGILLGKLVFNISEFLLIGLDSSIEQPPKEVVDNFESYLYRDIDPVTKAPKYLKSFFGSGEGLHSNKYLGLWTTGELAAQLSDLEQFFTHRKQLGIELKIIGTDKGRSLVGQLGDWYSN